MHWFADTYGAGLTAIPVLIYLSATFAHQASPHPGTRVITREGLQALKTALRGFVVAFVGGEINLARAAKLLVDFGLTPAQLLDRYSTAT